MSGAATKGRLQAGAGLALVACVALLALISLAWTPGGVTGSDTPLVEPGPTHWLGTDQTGRDVVSGLMSATLTSLLLAWFATLVSLAIGIPAAALAAAQLGEGSTGRPAVIGLLPISLCIGVVLSALQVQSTLSVFLAIALPGAVAVAIGGRLIMAPILGTAYFAAARLAGISWLAAAQRHVVPKAMPLLIALGLELLAAALLIEITLSFVGLGVDSSGLSLGSMLRDGQQVAAMRPLLVIVPGLVGVVTSLALIVAAGGLRLGSHSEGSDGAA